MPRDLVENDRKKNQFSKEERFHLLRIMKRYAPLLEKNASTVVRKGIWTAIEEEFKEAGFTQKTSAQLKKYWQNYKYHCKKARALGKDNETPSNLSTNNDGKSTRIVGSEWNRYRYFLENDPPFESTEVSEILGRFPEDSRRPKIESGCSFTEIYENNGGFFRKLNVSTTSDISIDRTKIKVENNDEELTSDDIDIVKDEIEAPESGDFNIEDSKEKRGSVNGDQNDAMSTPTERKMRNHVVVSNAEISDNSVTVSVIYPENEARVSSLKASTSNRESGNVLIENTNDVIRISDNGEQIPGCNSQDSVIYDKILERSEKEDRSFAPTENQCANDAKVTANLEIGSDSSRTRNVFLHSECRSKLKHRLLLHQLETEEKRLKVKIAEMAIQEIRLRIKALNEDMKRTEELYQLHLAHALSKNVQ